MQQGELIVTGKDQAVIPLNSFPSEVKAHFIDELELVPCNPHNFDTLEYEVTSTSQGVFLVINWSVTGVREIKWHASY
jgi:hypothetical protein